MQRWGVASATVLVIRSTRAAGSTIDNWLSEKNIRRKVLGRDPGSFLSNTVWQSRPELSLRLDVIANGSIASRTCEGYLELDDRQRKNLNYLVTIAPLTD